MNIDKIYGSYLRMRRILSASVEAAIDYGLPALDAFDSDLRVLDAGTFLLLFGVLEQSARSLAVARATKHSERAYFRSRQCKLDRVVKQLQLARSIEDQISDMGKIRDAAAHGQRIAGTFDLSALVDHIKRIDRLVVDTGGGSPIGWQSP